MRKLFIVVTLLFSSAYAAILPEKTALKAALENLEDHVYDEVVFLQNEAEFKAKQKKYYFDNLHFKYLDMAGKNVEVSWVVEQIKALFKKQINEIGIENIAQINNLDGSVQRRITGLDGEQYFQKLFEILFIEKADRDNAQVAFRKAQEDITKYVDDETRFLRAGAGCYEDDKWTIKSNRTCTLL